ncbi:PIN domain-containing protein [uncultured Enorma sp.]|uniref:type II toxin-antitoxin system VapC family toxin n=1 Tax=Enorma sp. TaxID=1920692 RepID=UPI00265F27A5|nr:PIN domain-containing protein [uncultured Enorma sp.]
MKNAPTLLIDTNIWIDAFDGDRKQHMRAHVLLDTAFERGVTLAFAVSSLKDVYYALSSALKRQSRTVNGVLSEEDARSAEAYAWACVQNMQEIATPVAVDVSDVWLAGKFRSQMHDFEDALVAAAASRCHADVLVTNDERFLRHSPVNAMDAADALTYITLSSL